MTANQETQAPRTMRGKPPFNYNSELVSGFLGTVFHTLPNFDTICAYATTGNPGYPDSGTQIVKRLNGQAPAMACYFGTATMTPQADERLYNRQACMEAMHVIILDDIGTKIAKDKMPESLDPTYKIETSKGNEQWGLVLEEPITDVEEAKLLVKLVYSSGLTDEGGAMPNKIVRLPTGVNGKVDPLTGEKNQFPVTLLDGDGPRFTPQDILDDMGLDLDWNKLRADPELVKRQMRRKQGASIFVEPLAGATAQGVTDPIVQWLYDRNQVIQDAGEWLTIRCPWASEHTSGDGTAGYSPLGVGSEEHLRSSRGFHCFHEHCVNRKGADFINHVIKCGGPQTAVYDPGYALAAKVVYDIANDRFYDLTRNAYLDQRQNGLTKVSFSDFYPDKVKVELGGATIKFNAFEMWKRHPSRVVVHGVTHAPGGPLMLGTGEAENQQLNVFNMPEYKVRNHKPDRVAPFKQFIDYLVPQDEERKYFLDWLACKAQNPAFRGNAIVMVADDQEGTGRGTLGKLIGKMWGGNNVSNVAFNDLFNNFNPFMKAMFVTCDETLMERNQKKKEEAYERLKSMIEPSETAITINEKNEKQYTVHGGPSFLFFSNHADAMYTRGQARRFFVIKNPRTPRLPNGQPDPAIFNMIYDYMATEGWEEEVFNWLLERDVDEQEMLRPAPETAGKQEMREASQSLADKALAAICKAWAQHSSFLIGPKVRDMFIDLMMRLNPDAKPELAFNAIRKHHIYVIPKNGDVPRQSRINNKNTNLSIYVPDVEMLVHHSNADHHRVIELAKLRDMMEDDTALKLIAEEAADALDLD